MNKQSIFLLTILIVLTSSSYANELDDVVVTAKSEKSIKDLAGAVTIITAEDIRKTNADTIKDILIRTTGIIESVNEGSRYGRKNISIRGSKSEHVLILINGKKVNATDNYIGHSDFQYSWIPTALIERIEVIKGPKSSIYGSQAIGGVVNIITKQASEKFIGEIDIKAGISAGEGGDAKNINFSSGGKITDRLSLILSADRRVQDVASGTRSEYSFADRKYILNKNATTIEGIDASNGFIQLNYQIDDTQYIRTSYTIGKESREKVDNSDYYELDRTMYDIIYHKDFGKVSFDITYGVAESDSQIKELPIFNYIHNLKDTIFKAETQISLFDNNHIILGAETSKEEYERNYVSSGITRYDYDLKTNAYFIQDEIELNNFIFTLGARLDDHENFGTELSPTTSVVYKLDEKHRIKASYGEGFMSPSVLQGSSAYLNTRYGIQGNDNLKPETSKSYELGYEYYGEQITFKTAVYKTKVKDLIDTGTSTTKLTKNQYLNIEEATNKGIEMEIEYDINEDHLLKANYNYLKTKNESTGNELSFKPKNTLNLNLSSNFENGFSTYVSAKYTGSQFDNSEKKYSGYTQFDMQISKEISENVKIRLGMDNITDKQFDDGEPNEIKQRFTYLGINIKF